MAAIERWTAELMLLQEAFVWLVPDEEMARTLVEEAGLPDKFIDFSEPVYLRIRRILLEATRRNLMEPLLATLTDWYGGNLELQAAIAAWREGEDRSAAALALVVAARKVKGAKATAIITRVGDEIEKVEVEVVIPESVETITATEEIKIPVKEEPVPPVRNGVKPPVRDKPVPPVKDEVIPPVKDEPVPRTVPKHEESIKTTQSEVDLESLALSDEPQPGDWFSLIRTVGEQERRLRELETWRNQLSISPTVAAKPASVP